MQFKKEERGEYTSICDMEENNNNQDTLESRGMELYEYIVDHTDDLGDELDSLILRLKGVDTSGQFLASTARYLAAVDRRRFEPWLAQLIEGAIEKDRERRYIGSLLQAIWGDDFEQRVDELVGTDNNFRRIYKRMHSEEDAM